jgi:hypothetical protein
MQRTCRTVVIADFSNRCFRHLTRVCFFPHFVVFQSFAARKISLPSPGRIRLGGRLAPSLPSGWEARRVEAVAAAEFALRIRYRLHPTAEQLSSSSSGDDHRFAAPRDWQGDGAGRRPGALVGARGPYRVVSRRSPMGRGLGKQRKSMKKQ